MPFGLSNSRSVFQGYMNKFLCEYQNKFAIVYIDDILIYSKTLTQHHHHVTLVLEKLCEHQLYLKLEKCELHTRSVLFLGYMVDQQGVQMDQRKVETIHNWPIPITVKDLQKFLVFANFYRRFFKNYSHISAPLTSSLKGAPKNLTLSLEAKDAFRLLKEAFLSAPILVHPDPDLPFIVEVDAAGESSQTPSMCLLFSRNSLWRNGTTI